MSCVYFDHLNLTDEARRQHIYDGSIFLNSPLPSVASLCDFARSMIEEAFPHGDPRAAQFNLPVEEFVNIVAPLKSRFTNHLRTKELIREVLSEFGCDADKTYFDVPRLRVATHGGYLTAGVGYALGPHRDTWYGAPLSQVIWWAPIYPLKAEQALVFYPSYFDRPVRNSSNQFDYDEWCRVGRQQAVSQIEVDTRNHPLVQEKVSPNAELRLVCDTAAIISFSGGQLHATASNTSGLTRFSLDFRTVHVDDLQSGRGARNIDSLASGTSVGDHLRASDFAAFPAELAELNSPVKK
jgi:hypothetical protein